MQIYADVTGRPMKVSRSAQTCALGSAIAAAVVAGAHKNYATAQKAMTGLKPKIYRPDPKAHAVYRELYAALQKVARRLRHEGLERQFVRLDEATD
jgi:L-ribulokinase